jgi:hypothetical protein
MAAADADVVAFGTGYRDGSIWALFVDPAPAGQGHGGGLEADGDVRLELVR